ncbi:MAG: alpha/beta hydrolase [Actinomycetes bacterium]|jgi:pimeloyl-ACP methyl ester carboxylesterase
MPPTITTLSSGVSLSVIDEGVGQPIVLLHGVCMSNVFFGRNIDSLSRTNRVIAPDFRGHGSSPATQGGHTLDQYARDVRALITDLGLQDVILAGWSMGSLVAWEYLSQFSDDHRLAGVVIISQGPSDLIQDGWPFGIADIPTLHEYVRLMQADTDGFLAGFVPTMFKDEISPAQHGAFMDAISTVGANTGSLILLDQTLRDYRDLIPTFDVPHLLAWGSDEKVIQVGSSDWLLDQLPNARRVMFEESGHCPMWEEAELFNEVVAEWSAAL